MMVMLSLNNNQVQAMAKIGEAMNELGYFNIQLKSTSGNYRVIEFRMYKLGEPGWIEYTINENGTTLSQITGGLD